MPLGHPLLGLGGSTLSLQLDVVVVAGVGSGHVEAVPATPISSLVRCIAAFSRQISTYQKTLAMAKPDPMMLISPLFPPTNHIARIVSVSEASSSKCTAIRQPGTCSIRSIEGIWRHTKSDAEVQDEVSSEHLQQQQSQSTKSSPKVPLARSGRRAPEPLSRRRHTPVTGRTAILIIILLRCGSGEGEGSCEADSS